MRSFLLHVMISNVNCKVSSSLWIYEAYNHVSNTDQDSLWRYIQLSTNVIQYHLSTPMKQRTTYQTSKLHSQPLSLPCMLSSTLPVYYEEPGHVGGTPY